MQLWQTDIVRGVIIVGARAGELREANIVTGSMTIPGFVSSPPCCGAHVQQMITDVPGSGGGLLVHVAILAVRVLLRIALIQAGPHA
jgi:hypothetical protein